MKKLVVMLWIAVGAVGAVATNLWLDLRAERAKARDITTRQTAAESTRPALDTGPQSPSAMVPAMTAPRPVAAPAATASAPSIQQPAARTSAPPMKAMLEAMSTPEAQDAMRDMMRREMAQTYPDIERELGISAQERQRLFDLLADQDQDVTGMMLALQDPAATRDAQRKMVEMERAREAKLSALLGGRYPKWEEYQATIQARGEVEQLRSMLSAIGDSLSEPQSTQLVTAFAAARARTSREDREWNNSAAASASPDLMQEMMQREADSRNRLVEAASPILKPAQLDRYKRQVQQEEAMMRSMMQMMTGGDKP